MQFFAPSFALFFPLVPDSWGRCSALGPLTLGESLMLDPARPTPAETFGCFAEVIELSIYPLRPAHRANQSAGICCYAKTFRKDRLPGLRGIVEAEQLCFLQRMIFGTKNGIRVCSFFLFLFFFHQRVIESPPLLRPSVIPAKSHPKATAFLPSHAMSAPIYVWMGVCTDELKGSAYER